jgi:hypothetical protein
MGRLGGERLAALLLSSMIAGACGLAPAVEPTIKASAETLSWADLSAWHTYRWWKPPTVDADAGFTEHEKRVDWYVRSAVDHELTARGYAPDTARNPDFVADGGGKDLGEALMGYERGMLTLELVDVATRRVAWRSQASAVLESDAKGKRVGPAVQKMMASLPAGAR